VEACPGVTPPVTLPSYLFVMTSQPTTKNVHISSIRQGDTVMRNGEMKTVSGTDLRSCSFMGKSLFGDSYMHGSQPVVRVVRLGCMPV